MWVLGFNITNWSSWNAPLSFALWIVAKLLCSCLLLFDAIIDLHAMDKKLFNDFLVGW